HCGCPSDSHHRRPPPSRPLSHPGAPRLPFPSSRDLIRVLLRGCWTFIRCQVRSAEQDRGNAGAELIDAYNLPVLILESCDPVGPWRSWERASMASRRSWVRIPSAPPTYLCVFNPIAKTSRGTKGH